MPENKLIVYEELTAEHTEEKYARYDISNGGWNLHPRLKGVRSFFQNCENHGYRNHGKRIKLGKPCYGDGCESYPVCNPLIEREIRTGYDYGSDYSAYCSGNQHGLPLSHTPASSCSCKYRGTLPEQGR